MSDHSRPEEGFAERIQREAGEEAAAVVADLAKVRFRADQVARVLRALDLPLPDEIGMLLVRAPAERPTRPVVAIKAPPAPAPVSAEPAPSREESPPPVAQEPESSPGAVQEPKKSAAPKSKTEKPSSGTARPFLIEPAPTDLRTEAAVEAVLISIGEVSSQVLQEHWPWANRATIERVLRHFYAKGLLKVASAGGGANATTYRVGGENVFDSWPKSSVGWKKQPAAKAERMTFALELVARQQDAITAVLEATGEHLVPSELRDELERRGLDLPLARVGDYLRELSNAPRPTITRTGIARRGEKQTQGRTAIEYRATSVTDGKPRQAATAELTGAAAQRNADKAAREDASGARQRPFPGDEADAGDQPPAVEDVAANALKRVRDHVAANPQHVHTYATIAKLCDLTEELATESLAKLALQGVVKPRPTGGYSYIKPTDPGAAARMDARRPHAPEVVSGRGGTVAGTGKKQVVSHPEVRKVLDVVRNQLGPDSYEMTPSGHWAIHAPKGRVMIAGTPSSSRSVLNDRARLRRAGIKGL